MRSNNNLKNAFTLVELIAVIGLLGVLITLVSTNAIGKIKEINSKLDKSLETIFLASAEEYVNEKINDYKINSDYSYCIPIKDVISSGYLSLDTFETQKKLDLINSFFKLTPNKSSFDYSIDYNGFCKYYDEYSVLDTYEGLNNKDPWIKKEQIEEITFLNTIPDIYRQYYIDNSQTNKVYDVSKNLDGSVLAWLTDNNNNSLYEMFIATNGIIKADTNSSNLFNGFNKLKKINFNNFSTLGVTNMENMFLGCIKLEEVILDDEFNFVGNNGYLPTQTDANITDADGKWYDISTKIGYTPDTIPNNKKASYTAIRPYPVLAANNTWYKGTTLKSSINSIEIKDYYLPTSTVNESWDALYHKIKKLWLI